VLVTGERGCFALLREERRPRRFHALAPVVETVSAVGAGDVFLAGFLAARVSDRLGSEALRAAVAVASASTLQLGAGRFDPREASRLQPSIEVRELELAELE
jgi:sugar/nucleoside kinase (ribokinase family)